MTSGSLAPPYNAHLSSPCCPPHAIRLIVRGRRPLSLSPGPYHPRTSHPYTIRVQSLFDCLPTIFHDLEDVTVYGAPRRKLCDLISCLSSWHTTDISPHIHSSVFGGWVSLEWAPHPACGFPMSPRLQHPDGWTSYTSLTSFGIQAPQQGIGAVSLWPSWPAA